MANTTLVIFDFDGVLVNTNTIAYHLHEAANPHLAEGYFERMHEGNFWENLDRAVREDGYIVQPDWYELYAKGLEELDMDDLLKMLVLELFTRHTLIIVSSMEGKYIEQALEKANIQHCFREVLGSDVDKSKVVKIRAALERHAIHPNDAIFITDTVGDIREGKVCGVSAVGVTWGMQERSKLASEQPYAVVDTVPELEATIEKFFMV